MKDTKLPDQVIRACHTAGQNHETVIIFKGRMGTASDWAKEKEVTQQTIVRWLRVYGFPDAMYREKDNRGVPISVREKVMPTINNWLYKSPVPGRP